MLSKAQNKYIRSLSQQKYRKEYNVFIAEGDKIAREWLASDASIQVIAATADWADQYSGLIDAHPEAVVHIVTDDELKAISTLQAPNKVLLVVHAPKTTFEMPQNDWCLALDGIQDPGNMGTIIRIADWFGIKYLLCAPGCVEVYNPKVVQAAMGGHLRVQVYEGEILPLLQQTTMPILAAALDGENIYHVTKPSAGIIVIGNESKGISKEIMELATHKIKIPGKGGAESLNAGVSAGIICALLVGG